MNGHSGSLFLVVFWSFFGVKFKKMLSSGALRTKGVLGPVSLVTSNFEKKL